MNSRRAAVLITALCAIAVLQPTPFLRAAPTKDIWLHCKHVELQDEPPNLRIVASRVFVRTVDGRAGGCTSAFVCVEWLRSGNRRVFVTTEPLPNGTLQNTSLTSLGDLFVIPGLLYPQNVYHLTMDNILPLLMVAYSLFGRRVGVSMLERLQVATLHKQMICPAIQMATSLGLPPIEELASLADRIRGYQYFEAVVLAPTRRVLEQTMANLIPWKVSVHVLPTIRRVCIAAVGLVVAHARTAHVGLYPERTYLFIARAMSRRFVGLEAVRDASRGAIFRRSMQQLGGNAALLKFVDLAELTFTQQVALVSSARMVAGMHGAALTHFLFTSTGTVCTQLLAHGFLEWEGRVEFANIARFAGCIYNEYEFPRAQTYYAWSYASVLNGDVLAERPRFYHGKGILSLLQIRDENDQSDDMFASDVLLLPSDVLRIVSVALNASLRYDGEDA